jgi:hypothetical protein
MTQQFDFQLLYLEEFLRSWSSPRASAESSTPGQDSRILFRRLALLLFVKPAPAKSAARGAVVKGARERTLRLLAIAGQ